MFTQADYDKLRQIMEESPEKKELLTRLLETHQMEVSALSHEIRTPLTLVYSTLQLIESEHPETLSFEHWNSMHNDIKYMNRLLQEMSSYNNGERLHLKTLHMESYLKSIALSFAASLIETNIEFTSKIDPCLPDICADEIKLRQVLLILLGNAREALSSLDSASRCRPRISLHACTVSTPESMSENYTCYLQITVADNGCGISPEKTATIFEPFITYKKKGTGLGLPIARRIASAHGGSLTVNSEPGKKTSFTLSLPVSP